MIGEGGIIGKPNDPTAGRASGAWRLQELFRARVGENWPVGGLIDIIYRVAKKDVAGDVLAFNPTNLMDPSFADQTSGLAAEIEVFHYSLETFPAGLTVTSTLSLGEDADRPNRVTALVVDGPLTLEAEIRVTNNRSRLAFVVLSRDDIDVGDNRNIVQPSFTYVQEPAATIDYRPYVLSKFAPGPAKFLEVGGDAGRGGPRAPFRGGPGGGGGVAFGGLRDHPGIQGFATAGADGAASPTSPFPSGAGGGGGGSPFGAGGPGTASNGSPGSLPDGGTVIIGGKAVTIPPAGKITADGGDGGAGGSLPPAPSNTGGGGGGAGGHPITIFHAGAFVNNGTITAAGGSGGPGPGIAAPGDPGGAGEINIAPVPTDMLNQ